jgi:hypothetical protein
VSLHTENARGQENTQVYGGKCRIYTGGKLNVEMNESVGHTAGKIWHMLNDHGPQTMAQLKKRLNGTGELVGFALGWLAREDKVDISQDKKSFKVALKE